jgi:Protein of unknown function (DUF4244)
VHLRIPSGPRDWARRDDGMTTAEYAVGTIAACAFAGLLLKLLTSGSTLQLLTSVVRRAFDPFLG